MHAQLAAAVWPSRSKLGCGHAGGKIHMVNLLATIPGTRKDRIVIAGHYDTKLFASSGSSARATADRAPRFCWSLRVCSRRDESLTIELLFLDGEEAVCRNWTTARGGRAGQHIRQPALR